MAKELDRKRTCMYLLVQAACNITIKDSRKGKSSNVFWSKEKLSHAGRVPKNIERDTASDDNHTARLTAVSVLDITCARRIGSAHRY